MDNDKTNDEIWKYLKKTAKKPNHKNKDNVYVEIDHKGETITIRKNRRCCPYFFSNITYE